MKHFLSFPIGIFIGTEGLYAAQLEFRKERYQLFSSALERTDTDPLGETLEEKAHIAALKRLKKKGRFRGNQVVLGLPSRMTHSFPMVFRQREDRSLEEELMEQIPHHLPFPPEEGVVDYISFHDMDSDHHRSAMMVAAKRNHIASLMDLFKKAAMHVGAVESGPSALIRLDSHLFPSSEKTRMLCHIGSEKSIAAITTQDTIYALREIPFGYRTLAEGLSMNLWSEKKMEEALIFLRKFGISYEIRKDKEKKREVRPYDRISAQLILPHVNFLIHELHQMMGYVLSNRGDLPGCEAIYIYGYGRKIKALSPYIEEQMGIRTACVQTSSSFPAAPSIPFSDAELDLPLGLALRRLPWL